MPDVGKTFSPIFMKVWNSLLYKPNLCNPWSPVGWCFLLLNEC